MSLNSWYSLSSLFSNDCHHRADRNALARFHKQLLDDPRVEGFDLDRGLLGIHFRDDLALDHPVVHLLFPFDKSPFGHI